MWMEDQIEKKNSISIVARKCETFVTSSTHDDGARKWLTELTLRVSKQVAINLRWLVCASDFNKRERNHEQTLDTTQVAMIGDYPTRRDFFSL